MFSVQTDPFRLSALMSVNVLAERTGQKSDETRDAIAMQRQTYQPGEKSA